MKKQKSYTESKSISFIIITLIYIIAGSLGLIIAKYLPYNIFVNIFIADVFATIMVFFFAVIFKNSSVYDPYWSVAPLLIAVALCISYAPLNAVNILLLIAISLWGVRLTLNWAYTFQNLNIQDWRYNYYQQKFPKIWQLVNFCGIFLMPTLIVYMCFVPAIILFRANIAFNAVSLVGFIVTIIAIIIEGLADYQMHKFRKNLKSNVIDEGLWKYSRHPNYLGEILFWWGVYIMSLPLWQNYWWSFAGALMNTLMFLFISIPLAENRYIKREGYEEYINKTSMLIPLPKK